MYSTHNLLYSVIVCRHLNYWVDGKYNNYVQIGYIYNIKIYARRRTLNFISIKLLKRTKTLEEYIQFHVVVN